MLSRLSSPPGALGGQGPRARRLPETIPVTIFLVLSVLCWVVMIWLMGLNLALCRSRVERAHKLAQLTRDNFTVLNEAFERMRDAYLRTKVVAEGWQTRCEFFTAICARNPDIAAAIARAAKVPPHAR